MRPDRMKVICRNYCCGVEGGHYGALDHRAGRKKSLTELGNPVREPRYLSARRLFVDDPGAGRSHERRFGSHQSRLCGALVAALDGVLDAAQRTAHARTARFVDFSTARDLARGLLGRFGVGH